MIAISQALAAERQIVLRRSDIRTRASRFNDSGAERHHSQQWVSIRIFKGALDLFGQRGVEVVRDPDQTLIKPRHAVPREILIRYKPRYGLVGPGDHDFLAGLDPRK